MASIRMPVFTQLRVTNYALYPGSNSDGLAVEFRGGLTLVLGANGLGKSTLVLMLYRLLTGAYDIPGLADRDELGTIRLDATRIPPHSRASFARRVADGAEDARATLTFVLGNHTVEVERRLSELELERLAVDGDEFPSPSEEEFQRIIQDLAGLTSFGDWILLLRYLVFYFEDRRALVWDPTAQRQVLRLLFLPAQTARNWVLSEREVLQLDSHMRNLSATLTRESRNVTTAEARAEAAPAVREELTSLEELQQDDLERQATLDQELLELARARELTRLRLLKAQQERESALRGLEHARLAAVGGAFPTTSESAAYVLSMLLAADVCLVSGHRVPEVAQVLASRIEGQRCVVCDQPVEDADGIATIDPARVRRYADHLGVAERELAESSAAHLSADREYTDLRDAFVELGARIATRAERVDVLIASLPPDEASLHNRRSQVAALRARVEELRTELTTKRALFAELVASTNEAVFGQAAEIEQLFEGYARGFLLESCDLTWGTIPARVGQTGSEIEFPAFQINLGGSDFASPVRRSGPEEVSESQREFIDLAFRMALMETAGESGATTLVIDAPESSLDAVFSSRAAEVLGRFAREGTGSRLILTSNLVEGSLIRELAAASLPAAEHTTRVVDLLELAEPTAAVREMRDEYRRVRDDFLGVQSE